jgi:hypothetical protein
MPDQPEKKVVRLAGAAKATSRSSGTIRVRIIHQSPTANPKLLKEAREVARELKEKRDQTKIAVTRTGNKVKRRHSLSLFPVKD